MNEITVIFGQRGRTTVPLPLRRQLGWQAGDVLHFRLEGSELLISRVEPAKALAAKPPDLTKILAQLVFALMGGDADG